MFKQFRRIWRNNWLEDTRLRAISLIGVLHEEAGEHVGIVIRTKSIIEVI